MNRPSIGGIVAAASILCVLCALAARPAFAGEGFAVKAKEMTPAEAQQRNQVLSEFNNSLSKGENGRFQAVSLDGTSIFVLDTRAGYLWVWTFGEKGGFIAYQGRVIPGLRMGDIIDSHVKKAGR